MKFKLALIILLLNFNLLSGSEKIVDQNNIHKNLRCLVCQGQSIADSNSDFAQTIKLVIEDQIKEGKSEKEIYKFLISKYGDWVVFKPLFNKTNFLLWFLPYLFLILGAMTIFFLIKKRNNKDN